MCSCASFIFACAFQWLALHVEEGLLLFYQETLWSVQIHHLCWILCQYQLHSSFRGAAHVEYLICTVESSLVFCLWIHFLCAKCNCSEYVLKISLYFFSAMFYCSQYILVDTLSCLMCQPMILSTLSLHEAFF